MKIIFLDIDGVVNSNKWFDSDIFKEKTKDMSDATLMLVAQHAHIDPEAVQLLNQLVDRSDAEVVLSSTWRIVFSPDEMTDILQKQGATFSIIDKTPVLYGKLSERIPRGKEIAQYISKVAVKPESFVILDDKNDMANLKKFLVLTDEKFGITIDDVEKALKILNGK